MLQIVVIDFEVVRLLVYVTDNFNFYFRICSLFPSFFGVVCVLVCLETSDMKICDIPVICC